jgi:radical SAM-linked protein
MKFVGHQDLIRVFHRAFRRSGITLDYSKGFHPHPKLRFSPPLALGIESSAEYLDFDAINPSLNVTDILQALQVNLPTGIEPFDLSEAPLNGPPVSAKIQQVTYRVEFPDFCKRPEMIRRAHQFWSASSFNFTLSRKGKERNVDLKQWVEAIKISEYGLEIGVRSGPSGSVHPLDTVAAILGVNREEAKKMKILKTSVSFDTSLNEKED